MEIQDSRLIYSFSKGQEEAVHFHLKLANGKPYVDVRIWFKPKDSQEWHPTKKGLFFPISYVPEFKKGIELMSAHTAKPA